MKFETYIDAKGEHRWRARASNGKIVADGAEGYASKRNVDRALARFVRSVMSIFDASAKADKTA